MGSVAASAYLINRDSTPQLHFAQTPTRNGVAHRFGLYVGFVVLAGRGATRPSVCVDRSRCWLRFRAHGAIAAIACPRGAALCRPGLTQIPITNSSVASWMWPSPCPMAALLCRLCAIAHRRRSAGSCSARSRRKTPFRLCAAGVEHPFGRAQAVRKQTGRRDVVPAPPPVFCSSVTVPTTAAGGCLLNCTVVPSASSLALASAAVPLLMACRMVEGALSTTSLASFRPRLVMARTALMTLIFLAPISARTTSNSVCSSSASAAVVAPPPAASQPPWRPMPLR